MRGKLATRERTILLRTFATGMKNVIITGASGMIGSLVLKECLDRPDVARVTSLVRRPSGAKHARLHEVVLPDMQDTASIAHALQGHDVAFYCIGAYTGALPKAEFRRVTVDLTVAFAGALAKASPQAVFCFLSGDGADRTGRSRIQFARDKGAAENFLFNAGFSRVYTFRPGYIYPVEPRREPNLMYRLARLLYKPLLSWVAPGSSVRSTDLAHAMVKVGLEGHGQEVLENRDIQRVAHA